MRKFTQYVLAGGIFLLSSVAGCRSFSKRPEMINDPFVLMRSPNTKEFNPYITSLQDIVDNLELVNYSGDFEEDFRSARETREMRRGDCDNTAILGALEAMQLGYKPQLLCVYTVTRGHVVALLEKRGKFGAIDRGYFIEPEYDSIDELVLVVGERMRLKMQGDFDWHETIDLTKCGDVWKNGKGNIYPFVAPVSYEINFWIKRVEELGKKPSSDEKSKEISEALRILKKLSEQRRGQIVPVRVK